MPESQNIALINGKTSHKRHYFRNFLSRHYHKQDKKIREIVFIDHPVVDLRQLPADYVLDWKPNDCKAIY